jgi:hypothetical protein
VAGSNVTIGDCVLEGQFGQPGDTTGEQNHGIFVESTAASLSALKIGNIKGKNLRGDVLYIGSNSSARSVSQIEFGDIIIDNIWRNGVSIVGSVDGVRGGNIRLSPTATYGAGHTHLDIEADAGTGVARNVHIAGVNGRAVVIAPVDAADYADNIRIGDLNLDPALGPNSNPPNVGIEKYGLQVRNTKYCHIGKAKINGFDEAGIFQLWSAGEVDGQVLEFGALDITDCTKSPADPLDISFVKQEGTVNFMRVGHLKSTLTGGVAIFGSCTNLVIGGADITNGGTQGVFRACDKVTVHDYNQTSTGSVFLGGSEHTIINGKIAAGATSIASFTIGLTLIGVTADAGTLFNTVGNVVAIRSTLNGTYRALYSPDAPAEMTAYKINGTTVIDNSMNGIFATSKTNSYTVATLPAGSAGMRAFVTDATVTTFAVAVAGGGTNKVPVFHDGTGWKIG